MENKKKILVVCTGNTCRSPMAEGFLRARLLECGLDSEFEALSCGSATRAGMPASGEAVFVMRNREIDISKHRSRVCKKEEIEEASLIVAMNAQHADYVISESPDVASRLLCLDIPDPVGMSLQVYEETARLIEASLNDHWIEIRKQLENARANG